MRSNNSKKSGNTREKLFEYWNIQGIDVIEPYAGGFVMIPNILFRYLNKMDLGGSQASLGMLMMYMRTRDFKKRGIIHPGHALIAEDMGTTPNTIERNLRKLKEMKFIEIGTRSIGNIRQSNQYSWNGFNKKFRELLINDNMIKEREKREE